MMVSVYRSHDASTTDYVCHAAQFCEDNSVPQEHYCWPYILEIARCNTRCFDGRRPAPQLKDFVTLAHYPDGHVAGHCHAQHVHLADALMAQLASEPHLEEA